MSAETADADVVLGIPIDEPAASLLAGDKSALHSSSTTTSAGSSSSASLSASSLGGASFVGSSASFYSARLTLSQRASHARALVRSPQQFVVFGGYLRLRESAREWRLKTWYCALLRAQLYFYPSKRDATRATNLAKRVAVAGGAAASDGQGRFHTYKHAFTFRTAHGHEYFCAAPSESERALWLEQLAQAAAQAADADGSIDSSSGRTDTQDGDQHDDQDGVDVEDDDDDANCGDGDPPSSRLARSGGGSSSEDGGGSCSAPASLRTVSSADADAFGALLLSASSASSAHTSSSQGRSTGCFACGAAFGVLRNPRRTCRSCARHFCRAHCSQYAAGVVASDSADAPRDTSLAASFLSTTSSSSSVPPDGYTPRRCRVCDACAHRQHFISFLETFTATAIRLMRHEKVNVATAAASPPVDDNSTQQHAKMRTELAIIVSSAANYTVLNVLCLLKKYAHVPWMFTRAMCLLIPLYERNPAALEEYWTQFLVLYVPLLALREPFSPSMQFFLRFVSAVCRRSNAFTLRTVWECLAFSEDARAQDDRMTRSYLTLLMIACSSFDGGSSHVMRHLLADAPRAQVEAITHSLRDFLGIRSVLRDEIPKSLAARWFNAVCGHEMEEARQLVLAAADGLEDTDALLRVLDPSQTDYISVLTDHYVRLPVVALSVGDECEYEEEDTAFMLYKEREFDAQAAFVERLTAISDLLRHVQPVERRAKVLHEQLLALEQQHLSRDNNRDGIRIHAPLLSAGGGTMLDRLRLLRVVPEEGKVFSTRSRAPTMMVFEACPSGGRSQLSATSNGTIIQGIPVNPEEEDELLENELIMSAQLVSMRLRATSRAALVHKDSRTAVAHKDSVMLDALLCGNDDATSSASASSDADDSSNSANGSGDDSGLPPDELLVQEARETYEDSTLGQFMASFRGGESSAERSKWKRKIRAASPFRDMQGWTVVSLIAKSHDDLRQEVFAMQLMRNLVEIFENNDLDRLYLRPYEILCTGANVGLIETLTDAQSVDAVKKQHGSLAEYFAAQFGSPSGSRHQAAQNAFITSVAASSLYCYLFQIKDRHNGNIMLDQRGYIMHIDFGFMMGSAPGGAFSLEDAPFKLTREMVDIMGGLKSPGYQDFAELFMEGFLAVRREYIKLVTLLHLTAQNSPYPCFQNATPRHILQSFRQRLFLSDGEDVARGKIQRLVDKSYNHWGTRQYDRFQYSSNGIMP